VTTYDALIKGKKRGLGKKEDTVENPIASEEKKKEVEEADPPVHDRRIGHEGNVATRRLILSSEQARSRRRRTSAGSGKGRYKQN